MAFQMTQCYGPLSTPFGNLKCPKPWVQISKRGLFIRPKVRKTFALKLPFGIFRCPKVLGQIITVSFLNTIWAFNAHQTSFPGINCYRNGHIGPKFYKNKCLAHLWAFIEHQTRAFIVILIQALEISSELLLWLFNRWVWFY